DGHVAFARPHLKARTAVRHVKTETAGRTGIGLGRGQQLILADGGNLGLGLLAAAKPTAANARRQRRHTAARKRTRQGARAHADSNPTCRLRHYALVRTLARPLADLYSLRHRCLSSPIGQLSGESSLAFAAAEGQHKRRDPKRTLERQPTPWLIKPQALHPSRSCSRLPAASAPASTGRSRLSSWRCRNSARPSTCATRSSTTATSSTHSRAKAPFLWKGSTRSPKPTPL